MLFGTALACDTYLSLMLQAVQRSRKSISSRKYVSLHDFVLVGVLMDIIVGYSVVFGSSALRLNMSISISMLLFMCQVAVTLYQVKQTRIMLINLLISNSSAAGEANFGLTALEAKLKKCVKISIISTTVTLTALAYHASVGMPDHNPIERLVYWSITNVSRIGVCFAQTYACSPIYIDKRIGPKSTKYSIKRSSVHRSTQS